MEGKHTLKPQGGRLPSPYRFINMIYFSTPIVSLTPRTHLSLRAAHLGATTKAGLTLFTPLGVTITQAWTTSSLLDTKIELADLLAPGAKLDLQNLWNPSKPSSAAQKINLAFKNPTVHSRAFINYAAASGNIDAVVDVTAGHEGFLVGGEAAYDVQKAAVTRYGLGVGYQTKEYTATLVGAQNLSVIAASYYQKVNSAVEVGAKAGYDVQAGKASGLEVASKYKLDPLSFAKVCCRITRCLRKRETDNPTGQDQRPRYCGARIQHQAQCWHHYRPGSVARHAEAE